MPNEIQIIETDLTNFLKKVAADYTTAKTIFSTVEPVIKATFVSLFQQALKAAGDGETAVADKGLNVTVDIATYQDILAIIAQAKAGDKAILASLATLGIKF
jgi:hypothetical protein